MSSTYLSNIVQDAIAKYSLDGKLTIPKNTLANIIYKTNSDVDFTGKDEIAKIANIRSLIRYYTGSIGDKNRSQVPKELHQISDVNEAVKKLQAFIDESDVEETEPYKIHGAKNVVIINDVHIPFFDKTAIMVMLQYISEVKPDVLYLNGDILDCYKQSSFMPDPRRRNTKSELQLGREFLGILRSKLPNARIIYKFGNHEKRWEDYLKNKAPELLDIQEFHLDTILQLNNLGIQYIPQNQYATAGHLHILHGHELGKTFGIPANPARWLYTKLKGNAAIGHLHVTSSHFESNIGKSQHGTFTIGCLCGLTPEYFPTAFVKWNHGFAHVEMDGDEYSMKNLSIIDGKIR